MTKKWMARVALCGLLVGVVGLVAAPAQDANKPKFNVKIKDEKTVVVEMEDSGSVDPQKRINFEGNAFQQGNMYIQIRTINNQTLHLSHFPTFSVNDRMYQAGQGGKFEQGKALPDGPGGKKRIGFTAVCVIDDVRITQTLELHPSKAKAGEKRLMNNVLVSYNVENKGIKPAKVGIRTYMDTYVIDNDGCMYASPTTHPDKILDNMVLEKKTLPAYLQMLQRPDLKNPGYISHLTLNVGSKFEKAEKLVLTRHGAGFNAWDMPAMPSMGDSAIGLFWPIKEMAPNAKRDVAYVYGEGIATTAQAEGRFQLSLGGSFEPGKIFTISAVVADPGHGQSLTLELPAGIERLEGKEVQPVGELADGQEYSTVLWKARIKEPGEHAIRVKSSTGITQSKVVSVTAEK